MAADDPQTAGWREWAETQLRPLLNEAQRVVDASGQLKVPAGHAGYLGGVRAAMRALGLTP